MHHEVGHGMGAPDRFGGINRGRGEATDKDVHEYILRSMVLVRATLLAKFENTDPPIFHAHHVSERLLAWLIWVLNWTLANGTGGWHAASILVTLTD